MRILGMSLRKKSLLFSLRLNWLRYKFHTRPARKTGNITACPKLACTKETHNRDIDLVKWERFRYFSAEEESEEKCSLS